LFLRLLFLPAFYGGVSFLSGFISILLALASPLLLICFGCFAFVSEGYNCKGRASVLLSFHSNI
jgi:hypothetical protein